jgi:hypothetical protein
MSDMSKEKMAGMIAVAKQRATELRAQLVEAGIDPDEFYKKTERQQNRILMSLSSLRKNNGKRSKPRT